MRPWEAVSHGVPAVTPWPPPEITQKLYQSRQARAFVTDLQRVQAKLGYYCDLQSIHAEDAMTWSVFGPLVYSDAVQKSEFAKWLFTTVGVPSRTDPAHLWLWRRLPHPDTLAPGGPEIDFGVQTSSTLLLGESKWRSGLGQRQGKNHDKDQMDIRLELVRKYGRVLFPTVENFVLLFVSPEDSELKGEIDTHGVRIFLRHCRWVTLCEYPDHPASRELQAYLRWKIQHSHPFRGFVSRAGSPAGLIDE